MTIQMAPIKHLSAKHISAWRSGLVILGLTLTACSGEFLPRADLAPPYEPPQYVVPASWHGASPYVAANPSDDELRPDWWTLYRDPVLDRLVEHAMEANPDLQAAAERFVQARDMMMKARSQLYPQLGIGFGGRHARQSIDKLFRPDDIQAHLYTWMTKFFWCLRPQKQLIA